MYDFLRRTTTRPLVGLWLRFSRYSWKHHVVAHDSPHVRAPGLNPDRVLITGDGAASGRGVLTHELGLAGFLARCLSARTGRATDVDIVVDDDMTADGCAAALAGRDLSHYDVIVLSIGVNEALALMPPHAWEHAFRRLVGDIVARKPAETRVFALAAPQFGVNVHFPRLLADAVDYHVGILNTISERVADEQPGVVFVPETRRHAFELEGASLYQRWADEIAARIAERLDPDRPQAASTAPEDERSRQRALEYLESLSHGPDPVLEHLTDDVRRLFGTQIAAVTFIRSDTQLVRAASGMAVVTLPRSESFCDVTIRRSTHLVIEDARRDHRYADFSLVAGDPGIRFYAGYPIESPDGHRVGALCVMDTAPRTFSDDDASALRTLAFTVQKHLYATAVLSQGEEQGLA